MKKVVILLLLLVLLVGCEKKKEEAPEVKEEGKKIATSNITYHDKNHKNNTGDSLDEITFYPDGGIFRRMCVYKGNCNFYSGEYTIKDTKIEIVLDEWLNSKGDWEKLPSTRYSKYEITDNNTFVSTDDTNAEFVLID